MAKIPVDREKIKKAYDRWKKRVFRGDRIKPHWEHWLKKAYVQAYGQGYRDRVRELNS